MKLFGDEQIQISKIHAVGKFVNADEHSPVEYQNFFPAYELIYYLSGSNKTTVDAVTIIDRPDSLRYLPKGQTKGAYRVEPISLPNICIDIYFDASSPMPSHPAALYGHGELRDKFLKLDDVWNRKGAGYYAESMKIFYDIICSIQKSESDYPSSARKPYMQKAHDYIANHYCDVSFDYKALCESTGLKYAHFSKLFKKAYGMPPVKFITKMRVDRAKELLVTNHYSVSEIAELCGFDNVFYFSGVFKKQTGFPPSKYPSKLL